ncbi:hypothetical protein T492DRAFT_844462 [Pavlovales sp. CCMP2436]|nr:hypothetical protein T492DRAFT_844462 [Pavlovales sp. CCMP2436]
MSNVYGALDSTVLDVTVDPYAIATSAVTQLSFSSLESPQNQTRDITKILKKKLPVATGNDELVFPFDSALFTAPLSYVAETALPISLGQTVTKAVGVQWSFSKAKPIAAGCITVLGDTNLLQDEATTDPKASTYTINQIMPDAVVAETTYIVNVFRHWFTKDKRDIEITRNPEGASSIAFNHQIYKPVIRICGGAFVSNAYSGIVCPISRLTIISNESRDIIGKATNGDPYNVIDNLVNLNTELITSKEVVNILSCTATADSWFITTDNQYSAFQVSSVFLSSTSITSSDDWQVATGWRITYSSFYQSNNSFNPYLAFDRKSDTYWASAVESYNSAGQGSQYLGIEYPEAVKMVSYKMDPNTRYTGAGAPLQWFISASNNNSTFVTIETFQFNAWQSNKVEEFFMSVARIPYKYWRITITLIKTTGVAIHTTISDISFISGCFKLILGNSYGVVVSMIDTPIDWQFNLLLIKNGRIVKCGLYNLSLTTGVTKLR